MEFRGPRTPLISDLLAQLDTGKAIKLKDCLMKFRKNEITESGFRRILISIVGDQNVEMVIRQLESQEEMVRSVENAPYPSALQSQVLVQEDNLPNPSAEMHENPIVFQHMPFAYMPISPHEMTGEIQHRMDIMDSRSTGNAFDQSAMQSQFSKRYLPTPSHVLPDLDGMQLDQLEQEREPSAFPAPGSNKLQMDMQFVHTLVPTCESAGGIQRQPDKAREAPHTIPVEENTATCVKDNSQAGKMSSVVSGSTGLDELSPGWLKELRVRKGDPNKKDPYYINPDCGYEFRSKRDVLRYLEAGDKSTCLMKPQPRRHVEESEHSIPLCSNMPTATSSKTPAEKLKVCKKKDPVPAKKSKVRKKKDPVPAKKPKVCKMKDPVPAKKPKVCKKKDPVPAKKSKVCKKKSLDGPDKNSEVRKTSKKQKVSGTFSDTSIEQLNDVTSASGVNLREEEEHMFPNPKRGSPVPEASQYIVQEDKDMLILEKIPFQQKLKKIVSKCGLEGFSNDVQPCLSLCVEERMRRLIGDLIRLSKQRLDVSDIGNEIMLLNRKAQDEWKTKQAEGEKVQKLNECLTATNVAARDSMGGEDILQLMAEIAKQKCGGTNSGSGPQPGKDIGQKMNTPQGGTEKGGRTQGFDVQPRTISVKDVIAALEREPQMLKSTLILKLYEKIPSDAATAS